MKVYILSYNERIPWERNDHGNISVRPTVAEAFADYEAEVVNDKENTHSNISSWYIEEFDLITGKQTHVTEYANPNWCHKNE